MTLNIVVSETDPNELKLENELKEIQALYEIDLQAIANKIKDLNIRHLKDIEQAYIKFNTPLPKRYKSPDMS